ncbi:DUF3100 domain-containing protein [Rothia sp. AR01]|uniref:DUF3100 domain-containing protein n=1 Tax=Rothia santali TaxID=2949643 RepID=A0A9X2HK08_9MICC|nr:DUF3100 domain-containing protein [Rothia santali]MCP3427156.1 DUF3100 domain-containing protein [Rothia santali]
MHEPPRPSKASSTAAPRATDPAAAEAEAPIRYSLGGGRLWILVALIVAVSAAAQAIGPLEVPLGQTASIAFLPMIWALVIGAVISIQRIRPLAVNLQHAAGVIMAVAVLVLTARLSLTMGPNLPVILQAGPALLLQEFGNVLGAIVLALPLAVLLRMGPATVGATFSIDREAAFAMVTERFGANSPQYRGVLSMYVFGSVFGAVIVTLTATLASSIGLFDPRALAMGAGVGSGSMMAAGAAAVAAAHPEMQEQVLALAASANLVASLAGIYLGVWISLPLADRFYRLLTRGGTVAQPRPRTAVTESVVTTARAVGQTLMKTPDVRLPLWNSLAIFCGAGVVVAAIAARSFSWGMVATYALLGLLVALSLGIAKVTRGKVPALIVVVTVGVLATAPISPVAPWIAQASESVNFLSVITVMLAVAGLSVGKDIPMLRTIGWKIVPVGIVVIAATFLASTLIAHVMLTLWG